MDICNFVALFILFMQLNMVVCVWILWQKPSLEVRTYAWVCCLDDVIVVYVQNFIMVYGSTPYAGMAPKKKRQPH